MGYRHLFTLILKVEENVMQSLSALLLFFVTKIAFKSSLDLYFHPFIIEFRIEEKIHNQAVPEDLNMKFRSKSNNGFSNLGCLHCVILSLQGKRYAIFPSKCSK